MNSIFVMSFLTTVSAGLGRHFTFSFSIGKLHRLRGYNTRWHSDDRISGNHNNRSVNPARSWKSAVVPGWWSAQQLKVRSRRSTTQVTPMSRAIVGGTRRLRSNLNVTWSQPNSRCSLDGTALRSSDAGVHRFSSNHQPTGIHMWVELNLSACGNSTNESLNMVCVKARKLKSRSFKVCIKSKSFPAFKISSYYES